jgi:hypothetical protein
MREGTIKIIVIHTQVDITNISGGNHSAKIYLKIVLRTFGKTKIKIVRAFVVHETWIKIIKIVMRH